MRRWLPPVRALIAVAAVAGLAQAASGLPGRVDLGGAPAGAVATPETTWLTDLTLACPGPELTGTEGVPDVAVDGRLTAVGAPTDALGAGAPTGPGTLLLGPLADPAEQPDTTRGALVSAALPPGAAVARAQGAAAPAVAALQEWVTDADTTRGLATATCRAAAPEHWLIGGGGAVGEQERLVLVNPGGNEVSAVLTVLGPKGPVPLTGSGTVVVPARGRSSVLLDGLAPGLDTAAIHVVVNGGSVGAWLTSTWLEGTSPQGADTLGSLAAPALRQVVPGAVLDRSSLVRVANPGTGEAVVRVSVQGPGGRVAVPGTGVARIPAGAVADLTLSVPDGSYAVAVEADVPVVAATRGRRLAAGGGGKGDLAWAGAAEPLTGLAGLPLPARVGDLPVARTLRLSAAGTAASVPLWLVDDAGSVATRTVTVRSDTSVEVALDPTVRAVWVGASPASPASRVRAAVVSSAGSPGASLLSSVPLVDAATTSRVSVAIPQGHAG